MLLLEGVHELVELWTGADDLPPALVFASPFYLRFVGERPLLVVVTRGGSSVSREELLAFLAPRVPDWWLPDDVAFVSEIPHTSTGKISKRELRERYARHYVG